MLLAADTDGGGAAVIFADPALEPGAVVR